MSQALVHEASEMRPVGRVGRRALIRGGALASAGLATAALFGCGGSAAKPVATPKDAAANAGGQTKQKFLNEDLLAINDPKNPYPYIIPEPDLPPKKGGTIRIAWQYDIASMDPTTASSGSSLAIPNSVGQRLIGMVHGARLNPFKIEVMPELAISWETSPDGLTYTFKLTDKAKFHNKPPANGRAFTAQDVKAVYERGAKTGTSKGYFTNVQSFDAVNPTTLQIKLKQPNPDFLTPLSTRESVIYPIEGLEPMQKLQDVIGTGPFILKEAIRGERVTFVKNPDFWLRPVLVDGSEWRIMPDQQARLAGYRAGQFDFANSILAAGKADADKLAAEGQSRISMSPVLGATSLIDLNLKNPKFQDERVRQALMIAYDRERAIQVLNGGHGVPYLQVIPWTLLFDKLPTQAEVGPWWRYDLAEAKKLLVAAGAEKLTFVLHWTIYTTDSSLAYTLDTYNKGLGINIMPKHFDQPSWNSQWQSGTYPDAVGNGINTGSYVPDGFFKWQVRTGEAQNRINMSDPEIDGWSDQQTVELDPKKRKELWRKIWNKMGQKAYRIDTGAAQGFQVYSNWLMNFRTGTFASGISPGSDDIRYGDEIWINK